MNSRHFIEECSECSMLVSIRVLTTHSQNRKIAIRPIFRRTTANAKENVVEHYSNTHFKFISKHLKAHSVGSTFKSNIGIDNKELYFKNIALT